MSALPMGTAVGAGSGTLTMYLHDNGKMDTQPVEKSAADPSTMIFAWNTSYLTFKSPVLTSDTTIAAGDSITLSLHRDAMMDNDYTTNVVIRSRAGSTVTGVATGTAGPVAVAGVSPTADAPPHQAAAGAAVAAYGTVAATGVSAAQSAETRLCEGATTTACTAAEVPALVNAMERVAPGVGTFLGSFYDVVVATYVDYWFDRVVGGSEDAELQEEWGLITLTLAQDVTVPAGSVLEVEIQTVYEGHPVDQLPSERVNFNEFSRPDIVTYVDRADTPTRVEFTLA